MSVGPEEFQRRLNEALSGLTGTVTIADDVLVYGCGDTVEEAIRDHDKKFKALLKRCRDRGIRLNKDKIKMHVKSVAYMGHLFSEAGLKPDPRKVEAINEMPAPTTKQERCVC